jgi:hypothetical protein
MDQKTNQPPRKSGAPFLSAGAVGGILGISMVWFFEAFPDLIPYWPLAVVLVLLMLPALIFRMNGVVDANPPTEAFDPSSPDLPPAVTTALETHLPALESLGFTVSGHVVRSRFDAYHSRVFMTVLANPKLKQIAQITSIILGPSIPKRMPTLISFVTEFSDDTRLITSNKRFRNLGRIGARDGSMAFPDVHDALRLHQIHEATLRLYCGDSIPSENSVGDPVAYIQSMFHRDFAVAREAGYYYLDKKTNRYRATVKGSLLTGPKLVWPIKPLLAALQKRRSRQMLRDLNLDLPAEG